MGKKGQGPVKVGVVGLGRGISFVNGAEIAGMKLVALCDHWEEKLQEAGKKYGIPTYTDYDKFLEQEMDAVILANYFHQHTPFAIKALEAGKHVMSETAGNSTLAEGVALCRAVEKSGLVYMLAENYAYTAFNQEMRRLYMAGEIGEATYADGEYNHPMPAEDRVRIAAGMNHWRNWIPPTYYCTHALAPLMYITDMMPVKVNCLSIAIRNEQDKKTVRVSDPGAVILCRMDNGAVFRIFGLMLPGHSGWYRVHGTRGAMETTRGPGYFGPGQLRVWHEEWDIASNEIAERTYTPRWLEHAELAEKAGHGGGDFWCNYYFSEAVKTGKQPYLDVYRGVAMSSVGILAWKSALEGGVPFDMPDFRDEAVRSEYEKDTWSPFPDSKGEEKPAPSILGYLEPEEEAVKRAKEIWAETGYTYTG